LHLNGSQQFTATLGDQFGNPMSMQPQFTYAVNGGGVINQSGLFLAGNTAGGPFTVTATFGPFTATATVTITDAPPAVAQAAAANPNPVAGTSTNLTVLGADDGG